MPYNKRFKMDDIQDDHFPMTHEEYTIRILSPYGKEICNYPDCKNETEFHLIIVNDAEITVFEGEYCCDHCFTAVGTTLIEGASRWTENDNDVSS